MGKLRKITSIEVSGLQEVFNYKIDFSGDGATAILIAPNGFGKTAFLAVVNACLSLKFYDAAEFRFDSLSVSFDDHTRWLFEKYEQSAEDSKSIRSNRGIGVTLRDRRREAHHIRLTRFDELGRPMPYRHENWLDNVPADVLVRAISRNCPVTRTGFNTWQDFRSGKSLRSEEVVELYRDSLLHNQSFWEQLGDFAPILFGVEDIGLNCVFIETQRLLLFKKATRAEPDTGVSEQQEEILRQADYLAKLLQRTYASYAAISQDLDRSFPNRLIARAAGAETPDISRLKADLNEIEERRKYLTNTGILIETSEAVVPPEDDHLPHVSAALQIYVEDSKKKLTTFDDIYRKVSVFRELLSKKLHPKEVYISKDFGVKIKRGDYNIELNKLSSGEKHEFIILFKLIFEAPTNSLILIDEPEISLHVSWQLEFMSDLAKMQSANQFQCIIATHSPQIIQGASHITFDLADQ